VIVYDRLSPLAKALCWAALWAIIYLILVALLPPNTPTVREYNLSNSEYRILTVLIGLPIAMVWTVAFFGYASLGSYTEKITGSKEGKSFRSITRGLKWLAWGLPITICITALLGGISKAYPGFLSTGLITSHYVYLVISIAAFSFMSDGTRGFRDIVNKLPSKESIRLMIAACIIISVAFCAVTLDTVEHADPNPYRLPLWLILLTIIIPYLYAWLMGFFAVFEISEYRRAVRGLFYRNALRLLAAGMTCAIVASIALQYMRSGDAYLRRIQFGWPMLISFLILLVFAIGFILIAVGANRLKKIEEV
jgi:hypothetical protein